MPLMCVPFAVAALSLLAHSALQPEETNAVARCGRITLVASVAPSLRTVEGTLTCDVASSGLLYVARYPELLTDLAPTDELSARREYPDGFEPATLTVTGPGPHAASVQAQQDAGVWQAFGPVAARTRVTLTFRTQVPARLGSFGARGGTAALLGGWHPVVGSGPGPRPRLFDAPIDYRIEVPDHLAGLVGVHPFNREGDRTRTGRHRGTMVPMLLAPALHVHAHPGAVLVAPRPLHPTVYGQGDISAPTDEVAHREALWTAAIGAGFLQQATGYTRPSAPPLLVVLPLRDRLSEAFEGGVALSDRAFHLLPFETFRRFHRASLWREQFAGALLPLMRQREREWPAQLLADAAAAALADRLLLATGEMAYAPQLLQKFSINPDIDALIYAPQVPFAEVYYSAVDESAAGARRFDGLLSPLPRGKIIYEKLKDLLGRAEAQRLLIEGLAPGAAPLLQRLEQAAGSHAVHLLLQWLGPYPVLDYRLTGVHTDAARSRATVQICGPDAGRIEEPITVTLEDRHGVMHERTRMGPGPVTFEAPGPMKAMELDPNERLVERHNPPRLQARYNNREPKRYRLLLNDLSATLDVTGQALAANLDLRGRRLYDLRHDAHLGAFWGPYSYGASASFAEHFGRELTPLKLAHAVAVNLGWSGLRAQGDGGSEPGQLWTVGLGYRYDTRLSRITALRGTGVDAVATAGFTHLDGGRGLTPWLVAGLSGLKLLPTWGNQALLLRLRGDHIFGAAPPQAQLRLGGRYLGARGFQMGEAFGNTRLLASAEYRHMLVGDSRTNLWGLVTLTAVEGAAFADGLYMPGLRPASYGAWLGDVGYGVRLMGDVLGVSPTSLAVDVAVPLGRRGSGRAPVTVYVAFVQSFLAF